MGSTLMKCSGEQTQWNDPQPSREGKKDAKGSTESKMETEE